MEVGALSSKALRRLFPLSSESGALLVISNMWKHHPLPASVFTCLPTPECPVHPNVPFSQGLQPC